MTKLTKPIKREVQASGVRMIKAKLARCYFFDWEISLLKKAGFKFPGLMKKPPHVYKILKDPEPIRFTSRRKRIIEELIDKTYGYGYKLIDYSLIVKKEET